MIKLKKLIFSLLPGLLLIGYNIGTGSITAMSKAGANFGTSLLWTVAVSCLIAYYLICLFSRYTMVTGETVFYAMRRHIHPVLPYTILAFLTVIILVALMGLLSVVSDILFQWSLLFLSGGIPRIVWAILIAFSLYGVLWYGSTKRFERILAVLVAVMAISFLSAMVANFPGWSEVLMGFLPRVIDIDEGSDSSGAVIIASMVGTTVSVFMLLIRSGNVKEMNWSLDNSADQKSDAAFSAACMFLLSAAVLIAAAGALHARGFRLNNISELVPALEPVFGPMSLTALVIGIVAAGLSSHLLNLVVIPWFFQDIRASARTVTTSKVRLILALFSIVSVLGVAFEFRPVFVLLLSQACNAAVLPIVLLAAFYLCARSDLMGNSKTRFNGYIIQACILMFSFYISYSAVSGVWQDLASLIK